MADYQIQKAIDRKDMSAKALKAMADRRYVLQPKWDGCHLVVKFDGRGFSCESATGEWVRSCDHIAEALVDWSGTFDLDGYAITGEVWVEDTPFPDISGAFRRHAPQPHLKFVVLDMVKLDSNGELNDPRGWFDRFSVYSPWANASNPTIIVAGFTDDPNPEAYALNLKNRGGFDGAIKRDMTAPYKVGRCRNGEVIKIKPLLELDLQVVGAKLDFGTKTGKKTAALEVRLKDGKTCFVATGLSQAEVDALHSPGSALSKAIVAVEAMGWTEDGLLREPRFKGVRFDKVAPDF